MKKLLLVLLVLMFAGCSMFKSTSYEMPTQLVWFQVSTEVQDGCFEWQDYRHSSQDYGKWKKYCEVFTCSKEVNIPGTFFLSLKAFEDEVHYIVWKDDPVKEILTQGSLMDCEEIIEVKFE